MSTDTITIYVELLDEGTPTLRPTQAVSEGGGLYTILAIPNYDPEDEAWEFLPGETVRLEEQRISSGEWVKVARHPDPKVIRIDMQLVNSYQDFQPTSARGLGNGLYEVLPTPQYDPKEQQWEFPPGSIVHLEKKVLPGGTFVVPVK
ncbi:MAG: hypothetical protein H6908_06480 [Hyphomicrobiales bacterium]|nr:hypothetical protein [Hyphomicrobiales bacterium]